jgi:hypothetical protein
MKNISLPIVLLFGSVSCGDPGIMTKNPVKINDNWLTGDSTGIVSSLNELVSGANSSIECAFSDLDTGYALDLKSRSTAFDDSVRDTAQNIMNRRNAGVAVTLVFDADKKCVSNGALFFQYPGFFQNGEFPGIKYKEMVKDCNITANGIPAEIVQRVKKEGLKPNREIFFVNTAGDMSDNFCAFDKKTVWFSQNPLNDSTAGKPAVSLVIEAANNPVIEEFTKEIEMLKNSLTGNFKKPYRVIKSYHLYDSVWRIVHGPQDDPLKYLAGLLDSASSLNMYSSGFDFDLKNPVVNSLKNLVQAKSNVDILFADTGIFSAGSFFQGFILAGNYCINYADFCANHLKYFNLKPDNDKRHIFLINDVNGDKKTVFYKGNLNQANVKNDDTLLIEIDSQIIYDAFFQNLNALSKKANSLGDTPLSSKLPQPGDLAITELDWMGSVDNLRNTHASDEAVELYNTTAHNVDIGGLVFACADSVTGNVASSFFAIPSFSFPWGVIIKPGQYFSIASSQNGAFSNANMVVPGMSIGNTTRECLLIDNRSPAATYYPAGSTLGHYNDTRLRGVIVDRVLSYSQDSWNLYAFQFFSKTGLNTLKYNIEGEGVRSMEKISPGADGTLLKNWHMNTFTPLQNTSPNDYLFHTFTSMGFENSPAPEPSDGSVAVSEVHWMGSYDSNGLGNTSDEFVEFYNRSMVDKNIGGWIFGCSTDKPGALGKPAFAIPYGTVIGPGQYLTVQKIGATAFYNIDLTLDFTLNNLITQCLLTDAGFAPTVFEGADANGDGVLSGHYDSPLFTGSVADFVSDRSSSFAALGLGTNNTTTKIRRSCERIDIAAPGNTPTNWKSDSITSPALNTGTYPGFKANTFATPGMANSN